MTHRTPAQEEGSRVTQVRILPPVSAEPGPFEALLPMTPEQIKLIFAFAGRTGTPQNKQPASLASSNSHQNKTA